MNGGLKEDKIEFQNNSPLLTYTFIFVYKQRSILLAFSSYLLTQCPHSHGAMF